MKAQWKKMIAPIIITIIFLLYYTGFIFAVISFKPPIYVCILGIIIPAVLSFMLISMCIQRIKEIRSGEEDDLSKY